MTTRAALNKLLEGMPEERLRELLDFAVRLCEEGDGWRSFGQAQRSQAYSSDEPDYTEGDLRPQLNS